MRTRITAVGVICSALVFMSAVGSAGQHQARVEMTVLGAFPGVPFISPVAINNRGDVVGSIWPTDSPGEITAFIWTRNGGFQIIAAGAVAQDINDKGEVAGFYYPCTGCGPAGFIWNERTGFSSLGRVLPQAINNRGDVAGQCDSSVACAIVGGQLTEWPCNLDGCFMQARAINDRGDVVVLREFSNSGSDLTVFLHTGDPIFLGEAVGNDINNRGVVVGYSSANFPQLWTAASEVLAPPVTFFGALQAVNARGLAVGYSLNNEAIAWDSKTNALTVLRAEDVWAAAHDVNDRGDILGTAFLDGLVQMVLWRVRN
jgi:uncharacterized membrane protein